MAYTSGISAADARAALSVVVPRLTALIRSIGNPASPAVGAWSAGDVAMHLSHAWTLLPALARGESESFLDAPDELALFTTERVRDETVRDLDAVAARIDAAAAAYLATPADDGERPWIVRGTALPASAFACHLLNESLVHGFDIAHAEGRSWTIEPAHAAMAVLGFVFPALSVVDPHFPVDQEHAAGVRARFDIRMRGAGRVHLVLDDGAASVEPPSDRRVDCHLFAEPTTLFLLIWARRSQWHGALRGRLVVWGRRPWLGMRLPQMLRNP
jgi:mycothiol maleylpyruvate isomerase-like protein